MLPPPRQPLRCSHQPTNAAALAPIVDKADAIIRLSATAACRDNTMWARPHSASGWSPVSAGSSARTDCSAGWRPTANLAPGVVGGSRSTTGRATKWGRLRRRMAGSADRRRCSSAARRCRRSRYSRRPAPRPGTSRLQGPPDRPGLGEARPGASIGCAFRVINRGLVHRDIA